MQEKRACQSSGIDLAGEHGDRGGPQAGVERFHQAERGDVLRDIDMRPHRQRVHPGIGASGGVERHRLAGHRVDRFLDRLLHRRPVRLALQAHERAAVEFEGQGEAGHCVQTHCPVTPDLIRGPRCATLRKSGTPDRPERCRRLDDAFT